MSDLIDRQAAIEIIQSMYPGMPRIPWMRKDWQERYEPYIRTENAIRELPSAQPEQRWISSGKKPPEEGSFLVWMPFAPPERRITVAEYCGGYWNIKTPISAWMPLPEPYGEEP